MLIPRFAPQVLISPFACDRLAADTLDEHRTAPGIPEEKLDTSEAIPVCSAAVEAYPELPRLHYELGRAYGVVGDAKRSFAELSKASAGGYPIADAYLGLAYAQGRGEAKNAQTAVALFKRAAHAGNPAGELALGESLESGRGAQADPHEAYHWYTKAAQGGSHMAQTQIGFMYAWGRGVRRDFPEAMNWFNKAAGNGDSKAEYALGVMYEHGYGTSPDLQTAVSWYRKSAMHGDDNAKKRLDMLSAAHTYGPPIGSSISYGSRAGMEVTVVSLSGLDSSHAVIRARHTRANAIAFCDRYINHVTDSCIRDELQVPLKGAILGNCENGVFSDFFGDQFQFIGRRTFPDRELDTLYMVKDLKTGELLDGTGASGYVDKLDTFKLLCPSRGKVLGSYYSH